MKANIRLALAVVAVGVFLCGAASTYATDCTATCKDETTETTSQLDGPACQTACDTFCVGNENVKWCKYKGDIVDGGNIPTVSEWGLVVMGLLVIVPDLKAVILDPAVKTLTDGVSYSVKVLSM